MKRVLSIFLGIIVTTTLVLSQTPASSVWPLTADQSAVVTGDLQASNQSLSNMQVSYSSSVQRSSPTGTAGSWPGETAENTSRYMQFAVAPNPNVEFTISTISMFLYVNSGSGMKANVYYSTDSTFTARTQIGATLTLGSSAPSLPNVTASPNLSVSSTKTFYIRIYPWYTSSTTGKYAITKSVTVSGTTVNASAPLILVSVHEIPSFGTVSAGTVSAVAVYTVSGVNLVSDIIVTAPSGFTLSKDSITYGSSINLQPTGGVLSNTKVFVRFSPASAIGTISEGIVHSATGAPSEIISVEGIAIAQEPATQSVLSFGAVTGNSIVVNVNGGSGNKRIVAARKDSAVSFLPVDGSGISGVTSDYSAATDKGGGNKAVYNDSGSAVTVTGLASGTKYFFAVFEYNTGEGNSQNYNTINPATGNQTTLSVPGLVVNPVLLTFMNVVVNKFSSEKTFSLSGNFLTPASGEVTVTAPSGFLVSKTSGAGFSSSVSVSYTNQLLPATTIYVQFNPTTESEYIATITNSGGGAAAINVAVSGKGTTQIVPPDSIPVGFASLGGGTIGGTGGTVITVTSGQQLADIMKPREKTDDPRLPLMLYISGTITYPIDEIDIKRTSNISIIGVGNDARVLGTGFKIVESSNIILRNITFADCTAGEGDGVSVEESHNIWIDHCSFTDSPSIDLSGSSHDGQLDVKKGSYNVTLSWNRFMNHRKTSLVGHSVSETGDSSLRATYYRNWFDGTYSRNPRVRYGKIHLLNNLYTGVGAGGGYGVGITCAAHVLVEGNYFENTPTPILISQINDPGETLSGDPVGYVKSSNNFLSGSGAIVENTGGYNFSPSDLYTYTAADAQSIRNIVKAGAGAGIPDTETTVYVLKEHANPKEYSLVQNYPNPFNGITNYELGIRNESDVTLDIFDLLGRKVAILINERLSPGTYHIRWDSGNHPSGVYFYCLSAGTYTEVKKMIIQK